MEIVFQWGAGVLSVVMLWKMGDRSLWGPVLGLVNQVFWIGFVFTSKSWGLSPAVLGITFIHARNFLKWRSYSSKRNPKV